MIEIPIQALPNQLVTAQLGGQPVRINIYQIVTGLYCDVYVGNALLIGGVLCENINRIVRDTYRQFVGDLIFMDLDGSADPSYTGLGSRWRLLYLEASDL